MSRVIDLSAHGRGGPHEPLRHPAGVLLPFDGPSDAALIIPEIRSEIRSGVYDADLIGLLDNAVRPGDRVLVIGAGLGVISTLIAKREEVERVIAIEANTALIPYLERTHAANAVERVETVNAVLAEGKKGRVPFFARRDLRNSSLLPHDRSWQQVMMVPYMDLNLILEEERITLVVSDIPTGSAGILARAELGPVERILLSCADDPTGPWEDEGLCAGLVTRGYVPEVAGTAVLFRKADSLAANQGSGPAGRVAGEAEETKPAGEAGRRGASVAPAGTGEETRDDGGDEAGGDEAGGDSEDADSEGGARKDDQRAQLGRTDDAGRPGGSRPVVTRPVTPSPASEGTPGPPRVTRPAPGDETEKPAPEPAAAQMGGTERGSALGGGRPADGSRRLWGLVALALFLALPLMLIGHLAGERGGMRMAAMKELGAAWGGPQTLTGPFLLVPVRDAHGASAEPLVILPQSLEVATVLAAGNGRAASPDPPDYAAPDYAAPDFGAAGYGAAGYGAAGYGALIYRSRNDVQFAADPESAAALLAPGETGLWAETRLALGISEPAALGAAYLLGGTAAASGFMAGTGAEGLPGIHAPAGDPRGRESTWHFVFELDGWRLLRLSPAGGTTSWRVSGDWPYASLRGPFRPALEESGARGFVAQWQIPEAAVSLPRAFRGTGPLAGLEALAMGVELSPPLDLYRTIERGAKLGLMVIALTFGAVLLLEQSTGRTGRVVHYALIGATQCAFFLLLLPLAERIGFPPAYAVAAVATTALLTVYAWSGLGLGARAGWVTLALAALYGVMYAVLAGRENTLLMGAVLAFLVLSALMWATREGAGRAGGDGP